VPVDTSALSGSVSSASGSAAGAASSAEASLAQTSGTAEEEAPLASEAMNWLDVFVEGFGEEVCKPNDEECLRRNRQR
jgi:hypothetical protein